MKAVFLDSKTFSANISFSAIAKQCNEFTCYDHSEQYEIIQRCLNADIIITNKVVLSGDILGQLPKLKLICIAATGMNNVDLNAAKKLNITVNNVSNYAGSAIAQYVFSQLFNHFQKINTHNQDVEQGLWSQSQSFCYHGNAIEELAGKTLGIIGYGTLAKSVTKVANAFNMKVLIAERKDSTELRSGRVSFETLLSTADIISLHCPQTAETINLIDANALSLMKNTAILLNTARGALIDNLALVNALENQKISHAFLDVLDQEPPQADHPLLCYQQQILSKNTLKNITITPHIAWASTQAQQRLISLLANNIKRFQIN